MGFVRALGVAIVLAAVAAPVVAQAEADLCLKVQAAPGVDLSDALAVQGGIGTGDILVTDVVPCDAVTAPVASATVASATAASDVGTGSWVVGPIEVDPMTDDRQAVVYLDAESGSSSSVTLIRLWIDCTDGSTTLTVGWRSNLGPERLIDVDTRIGDGKVRTERWINVEQQETDFGGADTTFIESLFGETRLTLRLTAESGPVTADFDISGIENAVANVREVCGW